MYRIKNLKYYLSYLFDTHYNNNICELEHSQIIVKFIF